MELRHRGGLVAVADAESLTVRQGENCRRHNPSLSRVLEDKVGAQLLTRGARDIELTPRGAMQNLVSAARTLIRTSD